MRKYLESQSGFRLPVPRPLDLPLQCEDNGETRIGYPGFQHCRLHADYQIAFAKWNCHCYTGQCRPTLFMAEEVDVHDEYGNEVYAPGYKIFVSGTYYRIPKAAFQTEKADMSQALLEYDAHVCCSEPAAGSPPDIECAWIKLPS